MRLHPRACGGVYPRACGGTLNAEMPALPRHGLSPRLRGNPHLLVTGARLERSIPAPAGEPGRAAGPAPRRWVYPRACGGTPMFTGSDSEPSGLSPRLRGNLVGKDATVELWGSIPAPAGEPPASATAARPSRVYPRACGGTSPGLLRLARAGDGSIPAPAGEPFS